MNATPRLVPMVADSMAPTIRPGDLVAVMPGCAWQGDGLYVLCERGAPLIVRASSDFRAGVTVAYDNQRYSSWAMTRDEFTAAMLGKVFAVCQIIDHAAMKHAGILAPWLPSIMRQIGSAEA